MNVITADTIYPVTVNPAESTFVNKDGTGLIQALGKPPWCKTFDELEEVFMSLTCLFS